MTILAAFFLGYTTNHLWRRWRQFTRHVDTMHETARKRRQGAEWVAAQKTRAR